MRPKLRAWMGHMLMMMLSVDLGLMMGHRSTLSYVDHLFRQNYHSYIRQTDNLAIYYNMYCSFESVNLSIACKILRVTRPQQ